jgi:surfactin synthase thioesterase subunit
MMVGMVHQDLLLADQYSKLKVSDVKFSLISCVGNDDELRSWLNYSKT